MEYQRLAQLKCNDHSKGLGLWVAHQQEQPSVSGDNALVGLKHMQNPTRKAPEDSLGTAVPAPVGDKAAQSSYAFHLLCAFFVVFKVPRELQRKQEDRSWLMQPHHLNKEQGIKTVSMVS